MHIYESQRSGVPSTERLIVINPARQQDIIKEYHDARGHPGILKTFATVSVLVIFAILNIYSKYSKLFVDKYGTILKMVSPCQDYRDLLRIGCINLKYNILTMLIDTPALNVSSCFHD